jgi:hypothetical protein
MVAPRESEAEPNEGCDGIAPEPASQDVGYAVKRSLEQEVTDNLHDELHHKLDQELEHDIHSGIMPSATRPPVTTHHLAHERDEGRRRPGVLHLASPGVSSLPSMSAAEESSPGLTAFPLGEVLPDLRIPALPQGCVPRGLFALVKLDEPDGGIGWSVRATSDLNDEELLGVLAGYVEHLKQAAAASWDDIDPTRADG